MTDSRAVSPPDGPPKTVGLPSGPIRYREEGSGEPLLFVHGILVNALLWRKVTPLLASRFRCIVPDWPLGSHDLPMSPDADLTPAGLARIVVDFIDALDLRGVTLIGNDTGSALCQLVAAEHPDRAARIVLTPGDAYDVFPPRRFLYLKWAARLPDAALAALGQVMRFGPVLRSPLGFGPFTKRPIEREVLDAYVRPVRTKREVRTDAAKIFRSVSPHYTQQAIAKLRSFDRPVLIAWAADDKLFPVALARRLESDLPDARLELIDDSRTFVSEDQPERLAELIEKFAL